MMRICVSAVVCVPFAAEHILGHNFESVQTQALLGLWVQVHGMLHDVGGGIKVGCGAV